MDSRRLKLISRRKELGLSQEQTADKAKLSRAYYTNIELGVKTPSLIVAQRIAVALNASVDTLFFAPPVPSRNNNTKATGTNGK